MREPRFSQSYVLAIVIYAGALGFAVGVVYSQKQRERDERTASLSRRLSDLESKVMPDEHTLRPMPVRIVTEESR